MFLFSPLAIHKVDLSSSAYLLQLQPGQTITFFPSTQLYLLLDLSGKHLIDPTVLAHNTAISFTVSALTLFVLLKMPPTLIMLDTTKTEDGLLNLNDDWVSILYVELLEQLHKQGSIESADLKTNSLLTWAQQQAQKGYINELQDRIYRLQDYLEQPKLDSRSKRREFETIFNRSPKQVKSIQRFNLALENFLKTNKPPIDHYYDQAHWIVECKKYTGMTPKVIQNGHITR